MWSRRRYCSSVIRKHVKKDGSASYTAQVRIKRGGKASCVERHVKRFDARRRSRYRVLLRRGRLALAGKVRGSPKDIAPCGASRTCGWPERSSSGAMTSAPASRRTCTAFSSLSRLALFHGSGSDPRFSWTPGRRPCRFGRTARPCQRPQPAPPARGSAPHQPAHRRPGRHQ